MTARFVVRLLSADDALLAWAEVWTESRSQPNRKPCVFEPRPALTRFLIEQDGTVTKLAVHWPDLDVARVRDLPPTPVQVGQLFEFIWIEPVWLVAGMAGVVLPAVTVRAPVSVAPPAGGFVASSPA